MPHGHAMPLHAGLTTVVWRVSYLIGGGGSTVYPPLGRAGHGEQQQIRTGSWLEVENGSVFGALHLHRDHCLVYHFFKLS